MSGTRVGILALQGAFIEHRRKLEELGMTCLELRSASDARKPYDRLVLPGGESTAQGKLIHDLGMAETLRERILGGMPVLATCAGLILLAERIEGDEDSSHLAEDTSSARCEVQGLRTLPVTVRRNAYGRQRASFHAQGDFGDMSDVPLTFIRAPYVTETRDDVTIMTRHDGHIVAVRYGNQIGLSFHPELDNDTRIHRFFCSL